MRAALEPAELALNHFAPSAADALADQALQDRFDLDAARIGRRTHRRLRLVNRHAVVDRKAQGDVVHGIAGLQFPTVAAGALGKGFCIPQARFDFPQPVVAQVAVAFDRARMHVAAPCRVAGFFLGHLSLSCFDAAGVVAAAVIDGWLRRAQGNLMIILPSADRDCMVLNASRKFSNGTTLPTTGCNFPDASQSNSCAIRRAWVSGSRFWIWARSTPSNAPPLSRGRLNASAGMVPEAKPTTRCRPRQAIERNACSATSPPTGSKITSGPCPPVNSFSVSRQSALV